METLPSFLIAAFALTGSPGPNTLSAAAVGASFGRTRGLEYMAGLNVGVALVLVIVGSGISGALLALPGIAPAITLAATAYFLYLAYRIATAPPLGSLKNTDAINAPRWYEGVFLSLTNPKAYAAMAALISGYTLLPEAPLQDAGLKSACALTVVCIVNFFWLSVGATTARYLQNPRTSRAVNILFAVLLILSVTYATFI